MTTDGGCRTARRVATTNEPRSCGYLGHQGPTRDKTAAAFRQPNSRSGAVRWWR